MVSTTQRDGTTWYRCEKCEMLFDSESEAGTHEENCDGEDDNPSYLQ